MAFWFRCAVCTTPRISVDPSGHPDVWGSTAVVLVIFLHNRQTETEKAGVETSLKAVDAREEDGVAETKRQSPKR